MAPVKYFGVRREAWGAPVQMLPIGPQASLYPHVVGPATEDDVPAILESIQGYVFQRRIRIKETFYDFDPLRSGRCTPQQFARAVSQLVPHLHEAEVAVLASYYTDFGPQVQKPQVVNYLRFVRSIDEVFAANDLEKQPLMKVPRPGSTLNAIGLRPVTQDEEARLQVVLRRAALLCRTRGVVLRTCFQDCERSDATSLMCPRYAGKVTPMQFRQHFPFDKDFSDADLQLLIRRYATEDGDINFQALDKDITSIEPDREVLPRPPFSARSRNCQPSGRSQEAPTAEAVLEKLKGLVSERRLQMNGMFQDFDRLRRGVCGFGQVSTVLTVLRIELNKEELGVLFRHFSDGAGGFLYRPFVSALVDSDPLPPPHVPPSLSSAPASARRQQHTLLAEARLEEVESLIAKRVRLGQLPLKGHFQDFDRARTGRVTRNQFLRIMDSLQCNLTEQQVKLIYQTYCDPADPEDPAARFAYLEFCASVVNQGLMPKNVGNVPYTARTGQLPKYHNLAGQVMPMRPQYLPRPCTR